jgi:hypothetical protein
LEKRIKATTSNVVVAFLLLEWLVDMGCF